MDNGPRGEYGSTFIKQEIPCLCRYGQYTLSFDAQTAVVGSEPGSECRLQINLSQRQEVLVYNGPDGPILPFEPERRSYAFTYRSDTCPQSLMVDFACTAPSGAFQIDNISLVGLGTFDMSWE